MNTKKKHKNRPKVTTNQPQKVEAEDKKDVKPKSDVQDEIPAAVATEAAVIAEVIAPVVESVEMDSESPKKPKRNKGKKKNQDRDFVEEDIKEKRLETVINEAPKTELVSNEAYDRKDEDENKSPEAAYVTPSTRKKKNKKKPQEQSSQESNMPEKEFLPIAMEGKQSVMLKVEAEIKELLPPKAEESKFDTKSKKKNKKKKRNDSERSDKSDSAFQQLSIGDNKPLDGADIKIDDSPQTNDNIVPLSVLETVFLEDVPKSWDNEMTDNISIIKNQDIIEVSREESNDKQIKKEKVLEEQQTEHNAAVQQDTIHKIKQELIEPFKNQTIKVPSPEHFEAMPEVKQDIELEPLQFHVGKEPSPKPEVKIAKPVEKKRRDQEDVPAIESLLKSTDSLTGMKEDIASIEKQDNPHTLLGNLEINIPCEEKSEKVESLLEPHNKPQITDTINVTDYQNKDKKRKKSPKPPKHQEKMEVKEESSQDLTQSKIEEVFVEEKLSESKSVEEIAGSCLENVTFVMSDEPFIPLQKSEKIDEVPPLMKIDDDNAHENKTGRRKKKTPKFPGPTDSKLTEAKEIKQLITPEATGTKEIPAISKPIKTERISESLAEPLPVIDLRSVKTDESGSSCEAIPDVQFKRSSSHQLLDGNNNMVIHEVRNIEDVKPNEQLIMPVVEGSGETPSGTPDSVSSGIRMTESKETGKEEPTYLKCKIMEVNQDMEELRQSFERSLAEFTAIEKKEQEAEKDYVSHRVECEKTFAEVDITKPEAKVIAPVVQMTLPLELEKKAVEPLKIAEAPPVCPARKDNKGKSKSKKKGKQEVTPVASSTSAAQSETITLTDYKDTKDKQEEQEKQEKSEHKNDSTDNKGKQQSEFTENKGSQQSEPVEQDSDTKSQKKYIFEDSYKQPLSEQTFSDSLEQLDFAPIESFEDALTSSIDDVNKSFEIIVNDNAVESQRNLAANKPEINITAAAKEPESNKTETNKTDDKVNPVSQPKNFLGHNDIPAQSNRTDYKKEKNKTPNERQAKVKIKDSMEVEAKKQSKESQTDIKRTKKLQDKSEKETFTRVKNDNEDYVYKYSFRKVFLQSACQICHKDVVKTRVPCSYCNLVFYCGAKHKDEDWTQHQALCFAVSTIVHLKDQKHIYADAQNITGQEYRLLRMQMIVSCEKVLKRRLVPWEQEAMLYPRMCGDLACREWRQSKLKDCDGCGQSHQRWCKSYHLYSKLVGYQQTRGRLEPRLPTKVMENYNLVEKINEVLAAMYEEKIDMNDMQYAALTQLATAPLTAAYCYQLCKSKMNHSNGVHKKTSSFTIHVVGAELQFEADALNKWEVFFLHLRPDVEELRVVLISPVLNPGDLPLDLLGKIRLCDNCRQKKRRVVFSFQDKKNYFEYRSSEEFVSPDLELRKDIARIRECSEVDFKVISEPVFNNFASVRPDRNFISDDEMP
ncbi:Uncharacterized protein OBRU01_06227, partial [Operophtera brumata]